METPREERERERDRDRDREGEGENETGRRRERERERAKVCTASVYVDMRRQAKTLEPQTHTGAGGSSNGWDLSSIMSWPHAMTLAIFFVFLHLLLLFSLLVSLFQAALL